jgi:glycosyltransferase involved in cell wall biosynthesis
MGNNKNLMSIKFSIIIRSYNEERHIGRLIIGIQKQNVYNSQNVEIIVVDSGSTDSTVSIAKQLGAIVIEIKKEEFSFGRALNIGCNSSKGNILIFVSAHVYPVYNDWLELLINSFSDENVGLVYGRQIGNDLTKFSEEQIFKKWFPSISNFDQDHPFCNNANCAIRRKIWINQPYDENITGLEDLDWAQKLLSKNYKIVYNSVAVIVHVHEETYDKIKNRYRREAIALKKIMSKVDISFFDFIRLFLYNSYTDTIQAVKEKKLLKVFKQIILFRYMQFLGTYLGHNHKPLINKEIRNLFYYPVNTSERTKNTIHVDNKNNYIDYKK